MAISFFADTWIGFDIGRDLMRQRGFALWAALIPRRDMAREGERTPCGWWFEISSHPLRVRHGSDARRIADRILQLAMGLPNSDVDYARVDGPPRDWFRLVVIDASTGGEMRDVIEANAVEGWVVRHMRDGEDRLVRQPHSLRTERVAASIAIVRRKDPHA